MTETKGLDGTVADKIGEYVKHKGMNLFLSSTSTFLHCSLGGPELLDILRNDAALMANPSAKLGIEEMTNLFSYLEAYNIVDKVRDILSFQFE